MDDTSTPHLLTPNALADIEVRQRVARANEHLLTCAYCRRHAPKKVCPNMRKQRDKLFALGYDPQRHGD